MRIIERIRKDFLDAYKSKEMLKKDYLGFIKSELTREDKEPNDVYVVAKLKSMVKKSVDSDGKSLLTPLEVEVLNNYIPKQLDEDSLKQIIGKIIYTNNITNKKGIGVIMKTLNSDFSGQFDGKLASEIIKNIL